MVNLTVCIYNGYQILGHQLYMRNFFYVAKFGNITRLSKTDKERQTGMLQNVSLCSRNVGQRFGVHRRTIATLWHRLKLTGITDDCHSSVLDVNLADRAHSQRLICRINRCCRGNVACSDMQHCRDNID